jgi:hypothetical protein
VNAAANSIFGMNAEAWLERAERLRHELTRLRAVELDEMSGTRTDEDDARERVVFARWLRREFSDEPPEDTKTLALFPEASVGS